MNHRLDIDPILRRYCEDHSTAESSALYQIERDTHLHTVKRLDASDTLQGRIISMISQLVAPKLIVEVGTFSAYATGCLAEGLLPEGRMISIEHNLLYKPMIERHLALLDISDKVEMIYGDALDYLDKIVDPIDLCYIDGAKYEYPAYYDLTIDSLRPGGVIIADNTLWKGRVLDKDHDRMTEAMHAFNQKIARDTRVSVVLLPYRDGLSIIRKH